MPANAAIRTISACSSWLTPLSRPRRCGKNGHPWQYEGVEAFIGVRMQQTCGLVSIGERGKGTLRRRLLVLTLAVWLTACTALAADTPSKVRSSLITLHTRPGATVSFLLIRPPRPVTSIVLLEGGPGIVDLSSVSGTPRVGRSAGFLATSRNSFAAHDLVVALVDAPSDKRGKRGMLAGGFRGSDAHVTDIDAVIGWLRRDVGLPVWLIGISIGSRSATHIAIHGKAALDGLILASNSTRPPRGVPSITAFGLEHITVPTLTVAHKWDACPGTPPEGGEQIVQRLVHAKQATATYFEGGRSVGSHPCRPRTYHTFYGIEDKVVAGIAQFIKANTK